MDVSKRLQVVFRHVRANPVPTLTGVLVLLVMGPLAVFSVANKTQTFAFPLGQQAVSLHRRSSMKAAFAQASLSEYEFREGILCVPAANQNKYVTTLVDAGLLSTKLNENIQKAITPENFFETASHRKRRVAEARMLDLIQTIKAMPGIEDATVHISEADIPGSPRSREVTALVGIKRESGGELEPEQIDAICQTVTGARAGLRLENVTVTDLNAFRSYVGRVISPAHSKEQYQRRRIEQQYAERIGTALSFVPDVDVTVTVELVRPRKTASTTPTVPEGTTSDSVTETPDVERIAVSVSVPRTYIESSVEQVRAQSDGENKTLGIHDELDRIEKIVHCHLPSAAKNKHNVFVHTVDRSFFVDHNRLPTTNASGRLIWLAATVCGGSMLAFAALLLLRHSRQNRAENTADEDVRLRVFDGRAPGSVERPTDASGEAVDASEKFRDQLDDLVRSDPDGAAEMLEKWIGEAS